MGASCINQIVYSEQIESTPDHKHNIYQMIYIRKGCLKLNIAGHDYTAQGPSVVFISNLENHSLTVCSETYQRYAFYIDPNLIHQQIKNPTLLSVFSNRPEGFKHILNIEPVSSHINSLVEMLAKENKQEQHSFPDFEIILLKALLIELYNFAPERFISVDSGLADTIWAIKQNLEQNVGEEISLENLAGLYHFSYCYLSRSFKRITGYSIKQYQILYRISHSKELLANTNMSITEIAQMVGFSDTSNFARYFKKIIGCTPTDYRETNTVSKT